MLNEPSNPSPTKCTPDFWRLLKHFWDADRIAKWKREIFPDPQDPKTGVDGCFNLVCLSPDAHSLWEFLLLSLWNFQMIGRSLLFSSFGNLSITMARRLY